MTCPRLDPTSPGVTRSIFWVETAVPFQPGRPGLEPVALGRVYSHKFGFGKVDAYR